MDSVQRDVVLGALAQMERNQAWLARRIGRSEAALSLYLSGHRNPPSEVIAATAAVLGVSAKALCSAAYSTTVNGDVTSTVDGRAA